MTEPTKAAMGRTHEAFNDDLKVIKHIGPLERAMRLWAIELDRVDRIARERG